MILEIYYDELTAKQYEIPHEIAPILEALSVYCDEHILPGSTYCHNCPFYTGKNSNECLVTKNGYGTPHEWEIYEEKDDWEIMNDRN